MFVTGLFICQLGLSQNTVSIYELDEPPIAPGCEELASTAEMENCTQKYLEHFIEKKLDSLAEQQIVAVDGVNKVPFWIKIDADGKVTHLTYRSGSNQKTTDDLYGELQKMPALDPEIKDGDPQGVRLIVNYIPMNKR